jgi:hypothetical protein
MGLPKANREVYRLLKDAQGGGSEGSASMIPTFLAQLGYVTIMILVIFTPITVLGAIKVLAGFMAVSLVFQMTLAIFIQKEMKASDRTHEGCEETVDSSHEIES